MIKTVILTISSLRTENNDHSGKVIQGIIKKNEFKMYNYEIIKDEKS